MTLVVRGGRAAGDSELAQAKLREALLRSELARVRAASVAWRNGLAALVAGLLGFGLLRGRDDVGDLSQPYSAIAGGLLALALLVGGAAALFLLRAAHGRLELTAVGGSAALWEHQETIATIRTLRIGIIAFLASVVLLVAAVGVTWYGPPFATPSLNVLTPGGWVCGKPVSAIRGDSVEVSSATAIVTVDLATAVSISAVDSCP